MSNHPKFPFRQLSVLSLAIAAACSQGSAPAKAADSASTQAADARAVRDSVQALLTQFTERMNSGDLEGAGKLYSDDSSFFWIENGSYRYRKAADIRASLLTLKNVPQIKMSLYETDIDVLSPTMASVRTEFSQGLLTDGGKGDTYGGYMTMLVVREADGWKMRNGHTSSRKPRPGTD